MKRIITLGACALLLSVSCQKKEEKTEETTIVKDSVVEVKNATPVADGEMCFLQVVSKDSILLTIKKEGENVSGTYKTLPFEKDKKTIVFNGTLKDSLVTAVGTAMAEGTTVKEEFIFILNSDKAGVKFGEMIEGDDGVYRYKNKNSASALYINKTECKK